MFKKVKEYLKHPSKIIIKLAQKRIIKISDEKYLKMYYYVIMGKKLNLSNPKTFNEKLQWLKINNKNSNYTELVDKYLVKEYISNKLGKEYVIKTLGVYNCFDEINFEKLPEKFVIKCTHDSGGIVVVRNKKELNIKEARKKITKCLKRNFYYIGLEYPYKDVVPKIIVEEYMEDKNQNLLIDYKFFCFNGEPKFFSVSQGMEDHSTSLMSYLDLEYNTLPFIRKDYKPFDCLPTKPKNFDKMIDISKKLSKDMIFVRVDLYEINQKIYFSELTFFPSGGTNFFNPEDADAKLGNLINLKKD